MTIDDDWDANASAGTSEGSELRVFLDRVRNGDEEAARELLRRYEAKVRLVVRRQLPRLLRSRFDSQDFLQSVWGSFFRRIKGEPAGLESPQNLVAFLARAARNKVIDEYRRASSRKQDMRREEPLWDDQQRPRELVDATDAPDALAQAREAFGRLREALPENRQAVLDLKAAGLSTREIGERLGLSERTVRRVIEDLRRRAGIDGDAPSDDGRGDGEE
jgi:RNA polymerase sigma-70 factor (ECF subfamily)